MDVGNNQTRIKYSCRKEVYQYMLVYYNYIADFWVFTYINCFYAAQRG